MIKNNKIMIKLYIVAFVILMSQGCSVSYKEIHSAELSRQQINALKICSLGYEYKNGLYISQIEKRIIEKASNHEEITDIDVAMLKAYSECVEKLR